MRKRLLAFAIMAAMSLPLAGCVKVVKIGEEAELTGKQVFSASENVKGLWEEAEANIEGKAINLPAFLTEANGDLKSLVDKYGKYSMGTSGTISYAVKGDGTVTEVNQEKKAGYITVKLDDYEGPEIIKIQIGSIYKGSSTRDTLDIIRFGDYTNQEEWAAVSQELHTAIDANVVQPINPSSLKDKKIHFTGTFTVNGNNELLITAVKLEVE